MGVSTGAARLMTAIGRGGTLRSCRSSSILTTRSMRSPAPDAAASARARASATARRSASRSAAARFFTSKVTALTDVAPPCTVASMISPVRSTGSTVT